MKRTTGVLGIVLVCLSVLVAAAVPALGTGAGAGVQVGGGSGGGGGGGGGGTPPPCSTPIVCESTLGSSAAPPPPWYTAAIHQKVLAARSQGLGYNAALDQFVPVNITFIKPGAWMIWPNSCTMGFVTGPLEILTAGHCFKTDSDPAHFPQPIGDVDATGMIREIVRNLVNPSSDKVVVLVAGSEKAPDVFVGIGEPPAGDIVYGNDGTNRDFARVPIDPQWAPNVDPMVEKIAGPVGGVYTCDCGRDGQNPVSPTNPLLVKFIGHGAGLGTGGTARFGLVVRVEGDIFHCHCPAIQGDSGGPVLVVSPAYPLGQAYGIIGKGLPFSCTFSSNECMSGTLMKSISTSVVDQRLPAPRVCQGEIRIFASMTTDLEDFPPEELQEVGIPYAMVYDDVNGNGMMDQGERFENKVSEAWWIATYFLNHFPPDPPGESPSNESPSITTNFQQCT